MSIFDLDETGDAQVAEQARANPATYEDAEVGFFDEAAPAIGMGIMRGGAKLGRAVGLAASVPILAYEKLTGSEPEYSDAYFAELTELTDRSIDYWTPNASEVGTAGRVMGNLAEIVLPLAAGGGNPELLMGSMGLNSALDLSRQGVDSATAVGVGMLDAATVGLGFRLPFLGSTFAQKAATGAAGSLALGVGATAADRAVLEGRGYEEIAEQYNPLDIEARTVDLLMGVAFGGIAHLQGRTRLRSERDAALAALNAKHFQNDTAPGQPLDEAALIAHQSALDQAIQDLNAERPVDVGPAEVTESRFLESPRDTVELDDVRSVLDELGIKDEGPATRSDAEDVSVAIFDDVPFVGSIANEIGVKADSMARAREEFAAGTTRPVEVSIGERGPVVTDGRHLLTAAREAGTSSRVNLRVLTADDFTLTGREALAALEEAKSLARSSRAPAKSTVATGRVGSGSRPATEPGKPKQPLDPDVASAESILEASDLVIETGEIDADGNQKTVSAREAMNAAREAVVRAENDAKGYEAAVACLLSFGD